MDVEALHQQAWEVDPVAVYNRANALRRDRKLHEALPVYREAIALKPDYAEAHCNLGHTLRDLGQFADALAALKKGHELGSKQPNWRYDSAKWVAHGERLVELDARLPAILKGEKKPRDFAEQIAFANLSTLKRLHGTAARFYQEALSAEPGKTGALFDAACAAALAGCGQGEDAAKLDEAARARWRKQALMWLRADLAHWDKALKRNTPQSMRAARINLELRQRNPDLAQLRNESALKSLPAEERQAWQQFWKDVSAMLDKGRNKEQP